MYNGAGADIERGDLGACLRGCRDDGASAGTTAEFKRECRADLRFEREMAG